MRVRSILSVCVALSFPCAALATPDWIIATPDEAVTGGEMLHLEVVRPDGRVPWPALLKLRLASGGNVEVIECHQDADAPAGASRRSYGAMLPGHLRGQLKAELADVASNRLLLLAAEPAQPAVQPEEAPAEAVVRINPIPEEEPALSAHDPVYFLLGVRNGANARYQLSFKYRIFSEASSPVQSLPVLKQLHFGYTQTAVWDLRSDSKPFHDTSYRPSLFWQKRLDYGATMPRYLRAGYEHESNGREGINSRSTDIAYMQPAWRADFDDGKTLIFAPRLYAYLDRDENPDIARYRGYADWLVRYGDESAWVMSGRLRVGTAGHAGAQFDLSMPFREPLFARTGGFVHFQLFSGYGETLLDYNQRHATQWRVGFSIVR